MSKRVRLTSERINSYGYRVLTDGIDMTQYEKNPVLLYMHSRGLVIGTMTDIKRENGEITGVPVFDEATELSRMCKQQWEAGSLRMVSIGFDVIETSDAPENLVAGQRRPTVTKSKLYEVSIVDIGANDDAIVLRKNGKLITLGDEGECPLPLLNNNPNNKQQQMELRTLALQLGLPETADEATVNAKLAEFQKDKEDADNLRKENEQMKLAAITEAVDAAVAAKKISADKKEHFIGLGKSVGIESLKTTLDAMSPAVKVSQVLEKGEGDDEGKGELAKPGPWEERMAEIRRQLNK